MMVLNGRYGKFIVIQVDSSFPMAYPGLLYTDKPQIWCTSFIYELDILLE